MLKIGSLVVPEESEDFLFVDQYGVDPSIDPIETIWGRIPGIIIDVIDFDPPRNYRKVRVMVNNSMGWTYSDYIKVLSL